jgi:hypothetical protein
MPGTLRGSMPTKHNLAADTAPHKAYLLLQVALLLLLPLLLPHLSAGPQSAG